MIRLTIVQTHPVQYMAPWFRHIAAKCDELELTVVYAAQPTSSQQGTGFDEPFDWDLPLLEGYRSRVVATSAPGQQVADVAFRGVDVPGIADALIESRPDVVLVPGWHSISLVRAMAAAQRRRIPVIYRGDTHLSMRPSGWRRVAWRLRTRAILGQYSAYLSVGRRSREYLLANGVSPERVFSSPHAVDNDRFFDAAQAHLGNRTRESARAWCGAGPGDFLIAFVGKLTAVKRPLDAVRAVAGLGRDTVLAIAGSGPLEADVRREAERLGVRVACLGFVNQQSLPRVYAAADVLVLPSERESWGLVVNEAMTTGLPAVVSDTVGCAPDLIVSGVTGETFQAGKPEDLTRALARVRDRGGRAGMADACRSRIARNDFASATTGLVAACQMLAGRGARSRVVACCGGMVIVSGLERMTFEVLGVVRKHGGTVHCIVNDWENERIVELVERIGATWSTGFYRYPFGGRPRSIRQAVQMLWDVVRTSGGLLRTAASFRPTHVLVPEFGAVLRNAPVLALLKLAGVDVVFRIANAPERGRAHDVLWRRVLPPFVTRFVPNSRFSYSRLQETGVPEKKITLIRNALSRRVVSAHTDSDVVQLASSRKTIVGVGQLAPFKGTHLTVEAVLQLLDEGFDVQAILVGALPIWPTELVEYVERLRRRVTACGAEDRVHFVGARENVLEIMKASYVLAAPILQEETFGNVLLEARSVGLPIVTFARGGLTELVTHGRTGYVCDTADLDSLLDGLRAFIVHPEARHFASANSLMAAAASGNDCTSGEFDRRWWSLFERAS